MGPFRVVRFALLKIVLTNYPLEPYGFKSKLSCINKKKHHEGAFFIDGDPNAMNLELLLTSDYYQATLERYEEIKRFEEVREAL